LRIHRQNIFNPQVIIVQIICDFLADKFYLLIACDAQSVCSLKILDKIKNGEHPYVNQKKAFEPGQSSNLRNQIKNASLMLK